MTNDQIKFLAQHRQKEYERRRRSRILGMAIDQCLTGIKNVITYGDPKWWDEADEPNWKKVKSDSEDILLELMKLERHMSQLENVYAPLLESNNANTTSNKN